MLPHHGQKRLFGKRLSFKAESVVLLGCGLSEVLLLLGGRAGPSLSSLFPVHGLTPDPHFHCGLAEGRGNRALPTHECRVLGVCILNDP